MNEEKHHHWSVSFKLLTPCSKWGLSDWRDSPFVATRPKRWSQLRSRVGIPSEPPTRSADRSPEEALPLTLPLIDGALLTRYIVRLLVGVAVLLAVRAVMKAVAIPLACRIFGVPSDDVRKARQTRTCWTGVPVYGLRHSGLLLLFLVPLLFGFLGLSWRNPSV